MADFAPSISLSQLATSLLPDLHASACMPCSDELKDAPEQPGVLHTLSPTSCREHPASRPASASELPPSPHEPQAAPPASAQPLILRALLASLAQEPLSQSIIQGVAHQQQRSRAVQVSQPRVLDLVAWPALQLRVQLQCLSCALRAIIRAALPRGGPPGSQAPRRQLCRRSVT